MATVIVFKCATEDCTADLTVGLDRLLRPEPIICYACGATLEVNNGEALVKRSNEALLALKHLSRVLDEPRMPFTTIRFTSHCAITTDEGEKL